MSENEKPKRKYKRKPKQETTVSPPAEAPAVNAEPLVIAEEIKFDVLEDLHENTIPEMEEWMHEQKFWPEAEENQEPSKGLIDKLRSLLPRESIHNLRRAVDIHDKGGTIGVSSTKGLIVIPTLAPKRGGLDKLKRMSNVVFIPSEEANS